MHSLRRAQTLAVEGLLYRRYWSPSHIEVSSLKMVNTNIDKKKQVLIICVEEHVTVGVMLYENGNVFRPYGKLRVAPINTRNAAQSIKETIRALCLLEGERQIRLSEEFDEVAISHAGVMTDRDLGIIKIARIGWDAATPLSISSIVEAVPGSWDGPVVHLNDATAHAYAEYEIRKKQSDRLFEPGEVFACLRIGEGVNVGVIVAGRALHGAINPEIGHLKGPPLPKALSPEGSCPVHVNCTEGLISFRTLSEWYDIESYAELWRMKEIEASEGGLRRPSALDHVGFHVGFLCSVIVLAISPNMVVITGGDSANNQDRLDCAVPPDLLENVRVWFANFVMDYPIYADMVKSGEFIRPATCGQTGNAYGVFLHSIGRRSAQRLRRP